MGNHARPYTPGDRTGAGLFEGGQQAVRQVDARPGVHDHHLARQVGRHAQRGQRLGQVVEDPVEQRHVERLEPEPRQLVEVLHLEPHPVARRGPVACEEAGLLDPVLAHVDPKALAGAAVARPVQEAAAVARDVQHAAPLEPAGKEVVERPHEARAGVDQPHLSERLLVVWSVGELARRQARARSPRRDATAPAACPRRPPRPARRRARGRGQAHPSAGGGGSSERPPTRSPSSTIAR